MCDQSLSQLGGRGGGDGGCGGLLHNQLTSTGSTGARQKLDMEPVAVME